MEVATGLMPGLLLHSGCQRRLNPSLSGGWRGVPLYTSPAISIPSLLTCCHLLSFATEERSKRGGSTLSLH